MKKICTPAYNRTATIMARFTIICFILALFIIGAPIIADAQCTLSAPTTCTGTAITDASGNVTIPTGTTYRVAAGVTYTKNVTFTDATSILCIDGTWTGSPVASPPAGTINVNGIINSASTWSYNGGGLIINVFSGAKVTIAEISISGGTYTITNCGYMTFTAATGIYSNGGTFTINNYDVININGTLDNSNSGFTFNNNAGSKLYIGNNFTFSAGTFVNAADYFCVTSTMTFSGGTLTNNKCLHTTTYSVSGSGAFTNNYSIYISGNFSNSGTNNTNNGNMTVAGNADNSGIFANNGTMAVTGNFSNSGTVSYGSGSLLTCVDWTSNGTNTGPGSGCAQIRATGATNLSGNFSDPNSVRVYFYDSGLPASGFDTYSGTKNSLNVNNNGCTPTVYPTCSGASAACSVPLPITLIDFKAECKNKNIDLFWATATEQNNAYFTIERSKDGINFSSIGTVNGAGNSSVTLNYEFTDPSPEAGGVYYRLKQTDYNGNFSYSSIVFLQCASGLEIWIYPNPVLTQLVYEVYSDEERDLQVTTINVLGQVINASILHVVKGLNHFSNDVRYFSAGTYLLRLQGGKQFAQAKFYKEIMIGK
jgi:hypothetical protein